MMSRLLVIISLSLVLLAEGRWPRSSTEARADVQTADVRVRNSCNFTLWIEARRNGQPLPGESTTRRSVGSGNFVEYSVSKKGLDATRFWAKYGCDKDGKNCQIGDQVPYYPGNECPEGGCNAPVDSLFEASFGCHPGQQCDHNMTPLTWFDTSQVDGFSIPYKLHLRGDTAGCDCHPNCNIDATHLNLTRCPSNEDLSVNGQYPKDANGKDLTSVDLRVYNRNKTAVLGCLSPCKKLNWERHLDEGTKPTLYYCCPTPNPSDCKQDQGCITPDECREGPIEDTKWVTSMHQMAPGIYSYSYDDFVGLHTCPAEDVVYEMEFCPPGSAPYPLRV
jgi:hypothetical protein